MVLHTFFLESSIYRPYLHGGQGFLVVYSITSRISFEAAQHFWETIKGAKPPGKAHIVLVGNKADLEFERQVGTDGMSLKYS